MLRIIILIVTVINVAFMALSPTIAQETAKPDIIWKQVDNYLGEVIKNGALRWPPGSMPLIVFIKPGGTTDGYRPQFTTMLEQAFAEWASASQNHVSFLLAKNANKAQIICDWTNDKNALTKFSEGGHALVIPDNHKIKQVRITILTKTTSGEKLSDPYLTRVALHEIGHALGLANHSPNPADIMYESVQPKETACTLTDRDKNTLVALYSINQSKIDRSALNVENMLPEKSNRCNLARIIRLNAEASGAMDKKNLALAVAKLEEAHQIDPKNDLVNGNLGAAYGNCAMVACVIKKDTLAQSYFNKALPLLSKSSNKENYISVLKYYENYLRQNRRNEEAEQIANRIKKVAIH